MQLNPLPVLATVSARFLAPSGLSLTDVFGQMHVDDFHANPRQVLKDSYYDTANLDLIRFGAILRFRASTHQNFWNLQLFTRRGNRYKKRYDLEYGGLPTEIPEQLVGLLYAFHRSQLLLQIGQIRVIEQKYELRDAAGIVYQEVIDMDITSSGALWEARQFHEFATRSQYDLEKARRPSHAFASAANDLGARLIGFTPKIIRALGPSLPPAFGVLETGVDSSSSVYLIFQRAIALSALRLLRFDPQIRLSADPEMVHEFRVGVRRLRSDLRSFSSVIQSAEASALRSELSWLGGVVGKVRDCDVISSHVVALSRNSVTEDESSFVILKSSLDDLCRTSRAALLEVLNSERYGNLIGVIVNIASGVSSIERTSDTRQDASLTRSSKRTIANIVRRRWRKYAKAAGRIDLDSSDLELHRVRILAKRCRYAVDSALPLFGDPARKFSRALAEVQDLLGRYHDCVVQKTWLREFAEQLPEARVVIGELILLMRQEQNQLRSEWPRLLDKTSSPKLRRWMENS